MPVAILLAEPDAGRRFIMKICAIIGIAISLHFVGIRVNYPHGSRIVESYIAYTGEPSIPAVVGLAYLVATGVTPILSSYASFKPFAAIVIVGSVASYFIYWEAFVSVWRFFATAVSAVLVRHFERTHQLRRDAPAPLGGAVTPTHCFYATFLSAYQ